MCSANVRYDDDDDDDDNDDNDNDNDDKTSRSFLDLASSGLRRVKRALISLKSMAQDYRV